MSLYVDTHCHLDMFRNPLKALDEAPNTVAVLMTELPSRYRLLEARFRKDKRVRVALGLHPLRAADAGPLEEGQLIRQLANALYIGEVGLDFSVHGQDSKSAQLRVFERLLAEPLLRNKVVSVHTRGAEVAAIDRLEAVGVKAILHWYTGPPGLVDNALAAGLYFSVNPAMLRTKKGQQLITMLPHDRLLTESDGPFARAAGHPAGPLDMARLVSELARLRHEEPDRLRTTIHDNLAKLYAVTCGSAPR